MAWPIEINQSDVDNLATKLDELSEALTPNERRLLSAMLQLAGEAIEQAARPDADVPVAAPTGEGRLSDGFRRSFDRGRNTTFAIAEAEIDMVIEGSVQDRNA